LEAFESPLVYHSIRHWHRSFDGLQDGHRTVFPPHKCHNFHVEYKDEVGLVAVLATLCIQLRPLGALDF
jgi:hypothetical protein